MNSPITDKVINAYLDTLVWSETLSAVDEEGEPGVLTYEGQDYEDGTPLSELIDSSDLKATAMWEEARKDLEEFRDYCTQVIGIDPFKFFDPCDVAHNFCLSRNGHGAGFFDSLWEVTARGATPRVTDLAQELQACARQFDTYGLEVWVDETDTLQVWSHL